jgi:hypothetical protein
MLHQQINNNVQPAMTVSVPDAEEAIRIVLNAMNSHPNGNFEYIFFEVTCPDRQTSYNAIKEIRRIGYRGIIIGMTSTDENFDEFTRDGLAQVVMRRPMGNRELSALLSDDAFISMSDKVVINNTASFDKVTREELEQSITCNSNALGELTRNPSNLSQMGAPSRTNSDNGHGINPMIPKDSNDSLVADDENLQDFFTSPQRKETLTPDNNRFVAFFSYSLYLLVMTFLKID